MTTTELVINQQALTLVWWHCFFNPTATRTIFPWGVLMGCIYLSMFPSFFFSKVVSTKPCSTSLYKYIYMLVERSILVKKLVVDIYVHWFYECKNQMKKKKCTNHIARTTNISHISHSQELMSIPKGKHFDIHNC